MKRTFGTYLTVLAVCALILCTVSAVLVYFFYASSVKSVRTAYTDVHESALVKLEENVRESKSSIIVTDTVIENNVPSSSGEYTVKAVRPTDAETVSTFGEVPESGMRKTVITRAGGFALLHICTRITYERADMLFITEHEVSPFFASRTRAFFISGLISAVLALLCAGFISYKLSKNEKTLDSLTESLERSENEAKRLKTVADGRKQFVDSLAHELKTPLTSILCFADLLRIKKNVSESERIEYSGIIVDEARRIRGLSSKLLELAVAENGELDLEKTSVADILTEAAAVLSPALEAKGIKLITEFEDGTVLCDRELFKSLIYNLTDNAAKASEAGQSVRLQSKAEPNGIVITVKDEGIGMTADVLRKISAPFYMADKSRSRKAGGAGLGLSLCVEIARRHGARITMKSRPGKGTSVFLTVPYGDAEAEL